jgi:hypothetical protein
VHADPNADLLLAGPLLAGERELCVDRRLRRRGRVLEGDEELVATAVDLVAAARRGRLADEVPVLDENLAPALLEAVREAR